MSRPGKRRRFGVTQTPDETVPTRYTRAEGSTTPIAGTSSAGPNDHRATMAPKRWEKYNG